MASSNTNAETRDDICENPLQEHQLITNESKIIYLSLAAEDEHGGKELLLHEQTLLSITPNNPQARKACDLLRSTSLIPPHQGATGGQHDIVYFDHDTLEKLELHQTRPLQRAADTGTVAVDWLSLCAHEKLKETLMTVYSRLRNIERIIVVVDNPSQSTIEREVQGMIRNQAFWQECNRRYALEQILPVKMGPPNVPQICLMQIDRSSEHDGDMQQLPRLIPLAHDLTPKLDDIDELCDPVQQGGPVFAGYSLQDLLD